jgi:hypothetical protein
MKSLKNIKNFDLFFESLNQNFGRLLNESLTEQEKTMITSLPEYQVILDPPSVDSKKIEEALVNLGLKIMGIVPHKLSYILAKDLEIGMAFLTSMKESMGKNIGNLFDIFYSQVTEKEDTDLLRKMAEADNKYEIFGENFKTYLKQKDPDLFDIWEDFLTSESNY